MASAHPGRSKRSHQQRFRIWQDLAPTQTHYLTGAIDRQLVPQMEAIGFRRVELSLGDPDSPVLGSEIELERPGDLVIDVISFNFEKYRSPRVQIHGRRRQLQKPNAILRGANLVKHSHQYYHFWGKPWWLPTAWWSDAASDKVISRLATLLPELISFLETGQSSSHISNQEGRAHASATVA